MQMYLHEDFDFGTRRSMRIFITKSKYYTIPKEILYAAG